MDPRLDLARELRRLLFAVCCAAGGLAGLWQAILTAPPRLDSLGLLQAVAARFGVGFGAGAAAGLILCLTLLRPRRRRES